MLGVVGCGGKTPEPSPPVVREDRQPAPSYRDSVAAYNKRVEHTDRLRARVVVRLRFEDGDGKLREEQTEGTLQLVLPDRVAMSLGKAGRTGFWFGCDAQRFWWVELQDEPRASVGGRTPDGASAREKLGVNVAPWDLVRLLGCMPIDANARGATEWSKDGGLIGITTAIDGGSPSGADKEHASRSGRPANTGESSTNAGAAEAANGGVVGYQRVWVDKRDWFPVRIELFDAKRSRVVVAELGGDERAELLDRPVIGHRPRMPEYVNVLPDGSRAEIRIRLSDITDQRVSDRAFEFESILKNFSVPEGSVTNLDAEPDGSIGAGR